MKRFPTGRIPGMTKLAAAMLLAAGVPVAAHAQSNVTLYGSMDAGVAYVNNQGGSANWMAQQGATQDAPEAALQQTVQPRSNIGDQIPHSWGGLPEGVPARRDTVLPTPAVHDIPPKRATKPLPGSQQLQLQKEMSAARARNLTHEDADIAKKGESAAADNNAALATARKRAGKPVADPAAQPAAKPAKKPAQQ